MMNFNITISAASIHGSVVILCLTTIIVIVSIQLPVDADDMPCRAALSLSIHHNGGNVSTRSGEGATSNFDFA